MNGVSIFVTLTTKLILINVNNKATKVGAFTPLVKCQVVVDSNIFKQA